MLDQLTQQPADALLAIIKLFNADARQDKIDLGVGVYRTADGATPVFRAIKAAEKRLWETQDSKGYLGLVGDEGFVTRLMPYVFGADHPADGRIAGMQTPGGTGAVRLGAAIAKAAGATRMLIGTPSWPNHAQILGDLDLEMVGFNHANTDGSADMDAIRSALRSANAGDAILLHGCCHNPTGVDYTPAEWDEIAALIAQRGVLPLVDVAYQGLGNGMAEDRLGLKAVMAHCDEVLVAYSCDKNFGVYRDRVGAFYVVGKNADDTNRAMSNAFALARASWSMPPDHGGAAIRIILEDEALTADWLAEVEEMRDRINAVRAKLAEAVKAGSVDLTPLARQNGMFATLPVSPEQVKQLREEHGVYMAGSGRINVAGLTTNNIPKFIHALADVTG
ncbi:aromatic amino acid transaminase [Aurantiacibacter gangjinensis]|uniref:Aromatic amino acid aminotransferase n=1 Tax=Aurantiacibacter gangjinensis TaxID=502682 RepID=A0A0G9MME1_9SPHN|nr:amino acid aminotransferase [Aurantiacibacter gangjinensis]APE27901.1 Aspartate aminotransferase [Aurantiacibacter gangjinensis]KLE31862.1 aromatic amino acid aminotransferase [Aurantiacibacter gangjinensis]